MVKRSITKWPLRILKSWIFRRPAMKSEHAAVIPHYEIKDATKINELMFFKDYLHEKLQ